MVSPQDIFTTVKIFIVSVQVIFLGLLSNSILEEMSDWGKKKETSGTQRYVTISVSLCFFLGHLVVGCHFHLCAKQDLTEDIFSPFRNRTPKEQFCMFLLKYNTKSNSFDSEESDPQNKQHTYTTCMLWKNTWKADRNMTKICFYHLTFPTMKMEKK